MEITFENDHGKNLDLRVKMCFTPKNCSWLGGSDFTDFLKYPKIKAFLGYASPLFTTQK